MDSTLTQQQQPVNGNAVLEDGANGNAIEPTASNNEESVSSGAPKSYDDLFPSLPASATPAGGPGGRTGSGAAPIGEWHRKPMLASSTVTQVFRIPMEERKNAAASGAGGGFGTEDSHRSLKNVMDKTGAKIEMSSSKDQSLTFLITGKQDQVLKARRELLNQFQTQGSQAIAIPKEHHRFILGKGGTRLQQLEEKTATKISIPKANDASDKITITGTKEGIEKALHEIRVTSDEQVSILRSSKTLSKSAFSISGLADKEKKS